MRSVTSLVRQLQRFADRPQTLDSDDVQDACQQLAAACDGMTPEQLVQQQVVSALAQLACALLGMAEEQQQQQQQQQQQADMQHADGDMAAEFFTDSMHAVSVQLTLAGNVLAQRWDVRAASRTAAADAAAQIQRTALLPRLARQMEAVGRAVLSRDGTALAPQAMAQSGSAMQACAGLLLWYKVLHCMWPCSLLASAAAGPASVAAGRLLLAALMLIKVCEVPEGNAYGIEASAVLAVDVCLTFLEAVSLGREQADVVQAPFLRQVLQSPAYPRLLLAHCLFSCGRLLHKHGDVAARQSLQPVVLQVGSGLGLGSRLVRWCMHTAESPYAYPAVLDFKTAMRELCTVEACDAIAQQQQQQQALMAPIVLLLLSTVAACVERAGEEAPLLMCAGAYGAHALLETYHASSSVAAAAWLAELLACALQLLELLLVQHRTSHNPMHARTGVKLVQVLSCIALLSAGCGDSAVWRGVLVRICSAAESLLRAPVLRGPDSMPLLRAFGIVHELGKGEGAVVGPLLAAAGGDQQQQQAFLSLLVTVWMLLPELQLQHSDRAIHTVVAGQLEAVLRAASGDGGGGGTPGSSSAIGSSSSSGSSCSSGSTGLHASSGGVPWLVLAAHAAHQAGTLLAAAAAPGAVQSAAPSDAIRQWWALQASITVCMQGVCRALLCAGPGTGTPAVTATPDVQLVQELQQEVLPAVQQGSALLFHAVSAVQREGRTSSNSDGGGSSSGGNNAVAAAGLDPALLAAVDTAAAVSSAEVLCVLQHSFVVAVLPQQLQDWAARLSAALPHRYCCNHPGCTNLAGVSELALVGGKGCICAGCRTARYCSATCQAAHWPQHRPVCRRLKREVAAAVAAASAAGAPAVPRV